MYAYSSFPSRFAVFRGPYHSTLRTELVDSTMVFDTTPSEDGSFYTATMRPWFGNIVGDDNMPDKMVRQVKIHSPSRKDHYGNPFSPSNERFVVLPFTLEVNVAWVHNRIPILAFESTNWMPRFDRLSEIQMLHRVQGDLFKYHYQNIHHIAKILMLRQPLTPDWRWVRELPDPYSVTNHSQIRAIPYPFLSPTTIYNMRVNVIYHLSCEADATAPDVEDYSSMFDAAAGYVAPAEEEPLLQEEPLLHEEPPALPIIPDFILENHLAHEVQKGTECPITFEPLSSLAEVAMSRDCGHFFEQTALKAWGKVQQNEGAPIVCPVCRKQLSEVVTMTNNYYIKPVVTA